MYSLLIVEDELLARLALRNSISWEKFNIDDIYEAQDGMEALEKYRKYRPDLLIVDINIPFMNGIELIQEIRKDDKKTRIIILSCLEDFQYAKAAIQANVSQYILKASMSVQEIEEAVLRVLEELKTENTGVIYHKKQNVEEEYRNRGILLRKLLSRQPEAEEDRQAETFIMPACLAVFHVDFAVDGEHDLSQEFLHKMNFVKSIIRTTLREAAPCYVVSMPDGMYAVLAECGHRKAVEELHQLMQNAANLIEKYTAACVRTGMSGLIGSQDEIAREFDMLRRKLSWYSFGEDGASGEAEEKVLERLAQLLEKMVETINISLRSMGLEEMEDYVRRVPEFAEQYEEKLQDYFGMLLNTTAVFYEKKTGCRLEQAVSEYSSKIRKARTLQEGEALYLAFLQRIAREHKEQPRYSALVTEAIDFAEKNCSRPVTLMDAARALHVSSGYLSTVFSREYGSSYTDFLIQQRIEKARILLAGGNEKLLEIAEKCGFNDQAYFTRTFKRVTGMSPNDYRKNI